MMVLIALAVIAGIAMILLAALMNKQNRQAEWYTEWQKKEKDHTPIKARTILTINEVPIFLKLRKALPEHIILTQVSLSALLSSTGQVTRNKLSRYRADFVVLDKDCQVIAIIELTDESHKLQNGKTQERETMLTAADYRILRYSHIPDIEQIQRDFAAPTAPKKVIKPITTETQNLSDLPNDKNFFDQDY